MVLSGLQDPARCEWHGACAAPGGWLWRFTRVALNQRAQASCAPSMWITVFHLLCCRTELSLHSSTAAGAAARWLQARSCMPALQHGSGCTWSLTNYCVQKPRAAWEKEEKVLVLYCNLLVWYQQNQWRDWITWPQFISILLKHVKNEYRTHFNITSVIWFGIF